MFSHCMQSHKHVYAVAVVSARAAMGSGAMSPDAFRAMAVASNAEISEIEVCPLTWFTSLP